MPPTIVVDAGPLVAYFDHRDAWHGPVRAWFEAAPDRLRMLSTEAVVTETSHLLGHDLRVQIAFVAWAAVNVDVVPIPASQYAELATWMHRYDCVPMDFADATLLWLYRATPGAAILTLDPRGFGVFRLPEDKRRRLKLVALPPPGQPTQLQRARHAR